jgi:hypothetical protein
MSTTGSGRIAEMSDGRARAVVVLLALVAAFTAAGCARSSHRSISIVALPPAAGAASERDAATHSIDVVEEAVTIESCGFLETMAGLETSWGRFGARAVLESNAGQRLLIECVEPLSSTYAVWYDAPGSGRILVGECPFEHGCNTFSFRHTGDADGDGLPDRIVATRWLSKDYGIEDGNAWYDDEHPGRDGLLDHAEFVFDAGSNRLDVYAHKYEYATSSFSLGCDETGERTGSPIRSFRVDGWQSLTIDARSSAADEAR